MTARRAIVFGGWPLAILLAIALWIQPICHPDYTWRWFAGFAALGTLNSLVAWGLSRSKRCLLPWAPFVLGLAIAPNIEYSPVLAFHHLYHEIAKGESDTDVLAALVQRFPEGGRFKRPVIRYRSPEYFVIALDDNDPSRDAEVIIVTTTRGVVSGKEYVVD